MSEWYFAKDGKQEGPVTAEQINSMVVAGTLNPSSDLVWREGLTAWVSIQASGILTQSLTSNIPAPTIRPVVQAVTVATPAPAPATSSSPAASMNPYTALVMRDTRDYGVDLEYPGFGRLAYFLWNLGIGVVGNIIMFVLFFAMFASKSSMGSEGLFSAGFLSSVMIVGALCTIPSIIVAVKRLNNLGMSGWAFLYSLIPFVNLWLSWRMTACPAGYADHKQLDKAGKVISWILGGFVILYFVMVVVAVIAGPSR